MTAHRGVSTSGKTDLRPEVCDPRSNNTNHPPGPPGGSSTTTNLVYLPSTQRRALIQILSIANTCFTRHDWFHRLRPTHKPDAGASMSPTLSVHRPTWDGDGLRRSRRSGKALGGRDQAILPALPPREYIDLVSLLGHPAGPNQRTSGRYLHSHFPDFCLRCGAARARGLARKRVRGPSRLGCGEAETGFSSITMWPPFLQPEHGQDHTGAVVTSTC